MSVGSRYYGCKRDCMNHKSPHFCAVPLLTGCVDFAKTGGGGSQNRPDSSTEKLYGHGVKFLANSSEFVFLVASRVGSGALVTIVTAVGADLRGPEIGFSGGSWAALLHLLRGIGCRGRRRVVFDGVEVANTCG